MINDNLKMRGTYTFENLMTGEKKVFSNLLTTAVFDTLLKYFNYSEESTKPECDDLDITHFAFGTGTTIPTVSDTQLTTETDRFPFTLKQWDGKKLTVLYSLKTGDANYFIKEIGIFSKGTATPGSGTLLSHALIDIDKNSNIAYNVYYTLTLD